MIFYIWVGSLRRDSEPAKRVDGSEWMLEAMPSSERFNRSHFWRSRMTNRLQRSPGVRVELTEQSDRFLACTRECQRLETACIIHSV
jgi:hypothetical protein